MGYERRGRKRGAKKEDLSLIHIYRYDDDTFTILIVVSVAVFCLGLLVIYYFDKLKKDK